METNAGLFERLRPRLTAISRRIVGSAAEAEDVVQDCFFKWQGAGRDALATPAAWLATVVRHQSIDCLRRRVRDAQAAGAAMELLAEAEPAPPEAALLLRAELGEALARLLARLSPAERLALVLHEAFDCAHADIAAALGTTPVNARQHLARARRRLRKEGRTRAGEVALDEKRCRELVRRFQAALGGLDVPAMVSLLADEQPVSVLGTPPPGGRVSACANDAWYCPVLAA